MSDTNKANCRLNICIALFLYVNSHVKNSKHGKTYLRMKEMILVASLLLSFPLFSQTKVTKKNALKANDYGIQYSLPKTSLQVNVDYTKTTYKAGPYYQYAEKYLGVKNAITEDEVIYTMGKVKLTSRGIPDPDQTYIIKFKQKTVAPYAFLTDEGLLCTINAPYTAETKESSTPQKNKKDETIKASSIFSEELVMAGSTVKQAEVAAKRIFRLRESKLDILTGEADNLPPDGESMKIVISELEAQEKALASMFLGTTQQTNLHYQTTINPYDTIDQEILFRFSTKRGVVDKEDLGGTPIYLSLKATEKASPLNEEEAKEKAKHMEGIIYNVPGKAQIKITYTNHTLFEGEAQITQFGTQEALSPVMFEDKKAPVKVYFYPQTGSIKQIIQ